MGSHRFRFVHPRLLMAGLLMLAGFGALATGAAAQTTDDPETTTLTTFVRLCLEPGCTEDLAFTEPVEGVSVDVTDTATGDVLGTCTTGDLEPGACAAEIATVESVTITLDEAAFPEGYQATDNPGQLNLADATEYQFLLLPDGGFPEDEDPEPEPTEQPVTDETPEADDSQVAELPSTGSGSSEGSTAIVLTASALAAATLGLAAIGARRMIGGNEA